MMTEQLTARLWGGEGRTTALVAVDRHGRIVLADQEAEVLFGHPWADLVGRPITVLLDTGVIGSEANGSGAIGSGAIGSASASVVDPPMSAVDPVWPLPVAAGETGTCRWRRRAGTAFAAVVAVTTLHHPDGPLTAVEIRVPGPIDPPDTAQSPFAPRTPGAGPVTSSGPVSSGGPVPDAVDLARHVAALADDSVRAGDARSWLVSIVRSSRDAIIGETLDGIVTSWNAAAERLYGYTAEEMIGRPVAAVYPPERQPEEAEILRRVANGENVEVYEGERLHRRGHRFVVELSVSPITDVAGVIVGAARVSRDVSARQRDEAKFRWLLDATALAIIGADADGRIRIVNREAQRLFGYSDTELLGQPIEILLPERARDHHSEHRALYVRDPRMRRMGEGLQLSARRQDGSEFPAEISLASIATDEGLLVAATVHDLTARLATEAERSRLQTELHRSERLESLGQLAGGVAHDFNNVLAIISTHASVLEDDLADAAEATAGADGFVGRGGAWAARMDLAAARESLAQVLAAAERGAKLTRQLLAFGRREVVRPAVFDLNGIVRDVEWMLAGTLGAQCVLTADLLQDPLLVTADPGRVEQALINLALNARDAMPQGGLLTVSTDEVTLGPVDSARIGLPQGCYVRLRVADTGQGMSPDVAEHAFEPFFTTKPEGQGTGLGLASVYGTVTQAGGMVLLDSRPQVGTTVSMLLPASGPSHSHVDPSPEAGAGRPSPVRLAGSGTILLVDDEPSLRASIETILVRAGYHVLTAASGPEAVAIAEAHQDPDDHDGAAGHIDLLLTDITMPGMSGREVADAIHAVDPSIHVLYMSGFAQRLLTPTGGTEIDATLIEKPFNRHDLLSVIADELRCPV